MDYIVDFAYDPLFDIDGKPEAILATVVNATDRVKARQDLEKAQDTLKQAIESANIGTWSADLENGTLVTSDVFNRIHSIPEGVTLKLADALKMIPAENISNLIKEDTLVIVKYTEQAYIYAFILIL
jgi:PAS domain-containing protein